MQDRYQTLDSRSGPDAEASSHSGAAMVASHMPLLWVEGLSISESLCLLPTGRGEWSPNTSDRMTTA